MEVGEQRLAVTNIKPKAYKEAELRDRRYAARFPPGYEYSFSLQYIQTIFGTHPTSCSMGTGDDSSETKKLGHETVNHKLSYNTQTPTTSILRNVL
jgi:hypothetical protein